MYSYKNKDNELISLNLDELIDIVNNNKNLISLSIKLNATVENARNIMEELSKINSNNSYRLEQYNRWSEEEDKQLEEEYKNNMSIKKISEIHGRTTGAIRSRLKHKNLYIDNTEIKNITTRNNKQSSGMFRIRYEDENKDDVFFYNIREKEDNINPTRPLFEELFNTEIGEKSNKFGFTMLDKSQYLPETKVIEKPISVSMNDLNNLKIYNLTEYIPKWCNRNDENSNRIIDLKNRYQYAIDYFYNLVYRWLEKNNLLNENTIIAVVPGHEASDENHNGTSDIARKLVSNSRIVNGINMVIRKSTINKKSTSMYRPTLNKDIKSMDFNTEINLNDKTIVILDDVTTHGDSFKAAAYHLYKHGARKIVPLAMGKTVIPNE